LGVVVVMAVALAATAAASAWAFGPVGETAAGGAIGGGVRAILAQFSVMTVVPIDPQKSFVEGYQAYRAHDFMKAIERMTLAADKYPPLADYALFYLASAQRDDGDKQAAAATFQRLRDEYPQSVFAGAAALDYAQIELGLGNSIKAQRAAADLVMGRPSSSLEQVARMVEARASLALGDPFGAYTQLQTLREKFPQGATDADARKLAYSIISAHPDLIHAHSFRYHRDEAVLLLREGQPALALRQIDAALALKLQVRQRAELTWLKARALRAYPEREAQTLRAYLKLAPGGIEAPRAFNRLGHLAWRRNDTRAAREMFLQVVRRFPGAALAPEAMFDIGRTHEDDGDWKLARAEYLRLIKSYPHSSAAAQARFRAPFALYMTLRYADAAAEFAAMAPHADSAAARDRFSYWHARALERDGHREQARAIYQRLAQSTASNYYPALAARRLAAAPALPAVADAELDPHTVPRVAGTAEFHLSRVAALRGLGLTQLEPAELRAIAAEGLGNPRVRRFVLGEFQRTGAWYDALETAVRLENNGDLEPALAERLRYPRAYWTLIAPVCERASLNPHLVLALIRQESLFNPQARSVSDARGLMQLLPSTAARVGPSAGFMQVSLDLYDPELSVRVGTTYLKSLFAMFGGDPFKAVAAYNGGENAVRGWIAKYPGGDDQWVENIGYDETRNYVKRVMGGLREYRILYPSRASSPDETQQAQGPT
jgi:peptidoglycan lytic transglycosylase